MNIDVLKMQILTTANRHSVEIELDLNSPDSTMIVNVDPKTSIQQLCNFLFDMHPYATYHSYDEFNGKLAGKVIKLNKLRIVFDPYQENE